MKIRQLSLVIDNKPGALVGPCRLLGQAGVNMVTLSLAEYEDYGILRLIVAEWAKAQKLLEANGYKVSVTDVVAVEVSDRPGGLVDLLTLFEQAGVNVAYMYAFTERLGDRALLVFAFDDLDAAITCMTRAGINPVASVNLYDRPVEE